MMHAVLILSVLASVMPAMLYLLTVRWLGRLEREPLHVILLVMAWGAIGSTVVGLVTAGFIEDVMALYDPGLGAFGLTSFAFYVPLAEELAKAVVLIALATTHRLSHTTSGLVYGMAVGLGFAITENIVYGIHIFQSGGLEQWYVNTVVRTLFSATAHGVCSAMMGFALGWSQTRVPGQRRIVLGAVVGLSTAVLLHGMWNAAIFTGNATGNPFFSMATFLASPILLTMVSVLTWRSLRTERAILLRELTEESRHGLMPATHVRFLSAPRRERNAEDLARMIAPRRYVALAGRLALSRRLGRPEAELETVRTQIRALLEASASIKGEDAS